jgi:hypothetical protein
MPRSLIFGASVPEALERSIRFAIDCWWSHADHAAPLTASRLLTQPISRFQLALVRSTSLRSASPSFGSASRAEAVAPKPRSGEGGQNPSLSSPLSRGRMHNLRTPRVAAYSQLADSLTASSDSAGPRRAFSRHGNCRLVLDARRQAIRLRVEDYWGNDLFLCRSHIRRRRETYVPQHGPLLSHRQTRAMGASRRDRIPRRGPGLALRAISQVGLWPGFRETPFRTLIGCDEEYEGSAAFGWSSQRTASSMLSGSSP